MKKYLLTSGFLLLAGISYSQDNSNHEQTVKKIQDFSYGVEMGNLLKIKEDDTPKTLLESSSREINNSEQKRKEIIDSSRELKKSIFQLEYEINTSKDNDNELDHVMMEQELDVVETQLMSNLYRLEMISFNELKNLIQEEYQNTKDLIQHVKEQNKDRDPHKVRTYLSSHISYQNKLQEFNDYLKMLKFRISEYHKWVKEVNKVKRAELNRRLEKLLSNQQPIEKSNSGKTKKH